MVENRTYLREKNCLLCTYVFYAWKYRLKIILFIYLFIYSNQRWNWGPDLIDFHCIESWRIFRRRWLTNKGTCSNAAGAIKIDFNCDAVFSSFYDDNDLVFGSSLKTGFRALKRNSCALLKILLFNFRKRKHENNFRNAKRVIFIIRFFVCKIYSSWRKKTSFSSQRITAAVLPKSVWNHRVVIKFSPFSHCRIISGLLPAYLVNWKLNVD